MLTSRVGEMKLFPAYVTSVAVYAPGAKVIVSFVEGIVYSVPVARALPVTAGEIVPMPTVVTVFPAASLIIMLLTTGVRLPLD